MGSLSIVVAIVYVCLLTQSARAYRRHHKSTFPHGGRVAPLLQTKTSKPWTCPKAASTDRQRDEESCPTPPTCSPECKPGQKCVSFLRNEEMHSVCICSGACTYYELDEGGCPRPVCGSDGNKYLNECTLNSVSCNSNYKLNRTESCINYSEKGGGLKCRKNSMSQTVAPSRPVDRPPKCKKPCGRYKRCTKVRVWPDASIGICMCRSNCPEDPKGPVCASDGVTYPNECWLEIIRCNKKVKLQLKHMGPCEPQTTTTTSTTSTTTSTTTMAPKPTSEATTPMPSGTTTPICSTTSTTRMTTLRPGPKLTSTTTSTTTMTPKPTSAATTAKPITTTTAAPKTTPSTTTTTSTSTLRPRPMSTTTTTQEPETDTTPGYPDEPTEPPEPPETTKGPFLTDNEDDPFNISTKSKTTVVESYHKAGNLNRKRAHSFMSVESEEDDFSASYF